MRRSHIIGNAGTRGRARVWSGALARREEGGDLALLADKRRPAVAKATGRRHGIGLGRPLWGTSSLRFKRMAGMQLGRGGFSL